MSKPEPKIDMKDECVDWKDVSELPEYFKGDVIEIGSEWKSIDGKVVTINFVKRTYTLIG
jgi:hypothetical protein